MKKTVLIVSNDPSGVVQYYRMAGPLMDLPEHFEVRYVRNDTCTWQDFIGIDIVAMCRPDSQVQLRILKMARYYGCEIWIDVDDWILGVPLDNPAFMHYQKEDTRHYALECISMADMFTVSTQELANQFGKLKLGGHVVKNSFRNRRKGMPPAQATNTQNESKQVYWRGSPTHLYDIQELAPVAMQTMAEYEDKVTFNAFGWFAFPFFKDATTKFPVDFYPDMPILEYFAALTQLKPSICIVPLQDNIFNRCKSNIAWIEATLTGAVAVVPDMPEWKQPGAYIYKNKEDFKTVLTTALTDAWGVRNRNWRSSMDEITVLKSQADAVLLNVLGVA